MKTFAPPFALSLALAASLAGAQPALAFSWKECLGEEIRWDGNTVGVRASPVSFPAGVWRSALETAVDRFNLNPSRFRYTMSVDSGGVGLDNGQNEVWGTDDQDLLDGAPARAFQWWTCYWFFGDHVHMDEVDVIFDYTSPPWQWASSENKANLLRYGGSLRPLQTTAVHELGHGVILNHVNTEYNVMGIDFEHISVNGSTARAYLGEDTADGTAFVYGLRTPLLQDLGVVHWQYASASGEYSNHTKTQLYNSAGSVLSNFDNGGEVRYWVDRDQRVRAEFTYENNGASTQSSIQVGFYISTNAFITTLDRRIGGTTLTLAPDNVFTFQAFVTIPGDLVPGRDYWLGAIIDETGSIAEMAEWNNATYLPIRVN
jgi:hypothetical protein